MKSQATDNSDNQVWTPPKRLTNKQKKFVQAIAIDGKSQTDAYIQAYEHNGSRKTAMEESSRTARLPQVKTELALYSDYAKSKLLTVIDTAESRLNDASDRDISPLLTVLANTANGIIDRVEGKSITRVQTENKSVNINIDLSSMTPVENKQ